MVGRGERGGTLWLPSFEAADALLLRPLSVGLGGRRSIRWCTGIRWMWVAWRWRRIHGIALVWVITWFKDITREDENPEKSGAKTRSDRTEKIRATSEAGITLRRRSSYGRLLVLIAVIAHGYGFCFFADLLGSPPDLSNTIIYRKMRLHTHWSYL